MSVRVQLTEFNDTIASLTKDFCGREWLCDELDALLEQPDCRFVVISGSPGVGKSALAAHLASTRPTWLRYFIRRDSRELIRPADAATFLLTIGGQLASIHPELFHPERLQIIVNQRVGRVEAGGEAIAVRVEELRVSPFFRVAMQVQQEVEFVRGKASAISIGRLISGL